MAEKMVTAAKTQEPKQKCSNSRKQNTSFNSSGSPADRILQLQRIAGNQAVQRLIKSRVLQAKLKIGQPNDLYEQEADRVAEQVMRMPDPVLQPKRKCQLNKDSSCEENGEELKNKTLMKKEIEAPVQNSHAPPIVHEVLRSPGQPLDETMRSFMEPRFGQDFSMVRVHTDDRAKESAKSINALAYTVGNNIVFGEGQYRPSSGESRELVAHELSHVVQQKGADLNILQRKRKHICENNPDKAPSLNCDKATTSPVGAGLDVFFSIESDRLSASDISFLHRFVRNWHAAGETDAVRVDGFASCDGPPNLNWRLSCDRAFAVANELLHPSDPKLEGIDRSFVDIFADGETDRFSPTILELNRRTVVTLLPLASRPAPTPSCTLPVRLGSARGCGSGDDFKHYDFPSISTKSAAKLAAWAATKRGPGLPFRSLITNLECELEMDSVLTVLAGAAGHAAFSRFQAGTGGKVTHNPSSKLGAMASVSGPFLATVRRVKAKIERQLAAQASSGTLDPCALSIIPPATHFGFLDGALKAVIGGTQGESLFVNGFTGNIPKRIYTIDLRFLICDDFGVDESDLYAPGLFAFWVLQHERSATKYAPFINELDLRVTVSGTF